MTVTIVICFLLALSLSLLINYLLLKFSFNLGSRNNLTFKQVRWSSNVKPSIGGISFFIVFLLSWGIFGMVSNEASQIPTKQIIGVVLATSMGFFAGLYDDAFNTNPLIKFLLQLSCAAILMLCDIKIVISNFEPINIFFTTVWVIGLMNSINMLDNMDGVTASVSGIIILGMITVILASNDKTATFPLIVLVGVLGALLGFLKFNWSPSRIYMGDTGSQFLGVFLAAISIMFFWRYNEGNQGLLQIKPFVLPALFFIVPIIDTTTVTIRRMMRGQSPFVGGKDHITHHLAYLGLKEKQVVYVLIATTVLSFPIAMVLVKNIIDWNFYLSFGIFGYVVALFFVFQYFYKKGEMRRKFKLKNERPIHKIPTESSAIYAEKVAASNQYKK